MNINYYIYQKLNHKDEYFYWCWNYNIFEKKSWYLRLLFHCKKLPILWRNISKLFQSYVKRYKTWWKLFKQIHREVLCHVPKKVSPIASENVNDIFCVNHLEFKNKFLKHYGRTKFFGYCRRINFIFFNVIWTKLKKF